MAFELRILDTISCPRCNATAELRIDEKKTNSKYVLVHIVCQTCRLRKYSHTTTHKAVRIHQQIRKLKSRSMFQGRRNLARRIEKLEMLEQQAEREF
jgi:uncharacterized protein YbaR (Trm112 family)